MEIFYQSVFDKWPLKDASVQSIITSPPYYHLRKYDIPDIAIGGSANCKHEFDEAKVRYPGGENSGKSNYFKNTKFKSSSNICHKCGCFFGQYGLELSPSLYITHTMLWLKESWRVLKDDGCIFIVIDDKYADSNELRRKCLMLIPERLMIAMQEVGWIIRNKIIWIRTMPESCKDRFSAKHETIIFATKNSKYYFNLDAVRERIKIDTISRYMRAFNSSKGDEYKKQGGKMDTDDQRRIAEKIRAIYGGGDEDGNDNDSSLLLFDMPEDVEGNYSETERICIENGYDPDGICPICGRTWKRHASANAKDRIGGIRRNFIPCVGNTKIKPEDAETMGSPRARYHRNKFDKLPEETGMCGGGHYTYGGLNSPNSIYKKKLREYRDNGNVGKEQNEIGKNPGDVWLDLYLNAHKQAINELGVDGYIEALRRHILHESDMFPPFIEGLSEPHYAPFSRKLVERLILCSSRVGDIILDPFCGSGTTLIVAERLNRKGIGFDLGYKEIHEKRLKNIQKQLPM